MLPYFVFFYHHHRLVVFVFALYDNICCICCCCRSIVNCKLIVDKSHLFCSSHTHTHTIGRTMWHEYIRMGTLLSYIPYRTVTWFITDNVILPIISKPMRLENRSSYAQFQQIHNNWQCSSIIDLRTALYNDFLSN